jgi:YVTN family beta-propeller protein
MIKKSRAYVVGFLCLGSVLSCAEEPNTVIATISVGDTPASMAVTPDNLFAYVANNNNDSLPGGDTVSVLNLTYNTLEQTISDSSFNEPYTVTINAAGTKAYVTNSNGTTVSIIDIRTNTVTGVIGGFDGPSGFVITPDGNHAYVNNYGGPSGVGSGNGTTVRVVDLNTNAIVGPAITVGLAPAAMAITPDGAQIYVINYVDGNLGTGTISIINTRDNSVQLDVITGLSGPFAIAITPNGKYAYITNFGSNNFSPVGTTVSVVSIQSNTIVATITLGIQPSGVAITPDGAFAYVTNYSTVYNGPGFTILTSAQGAVSVIDIKSNTVVDQVIGVGLSPASITISPNGQFAYVTNYRSNTVSVIALPSVLYDVNRLRPIYNLQLDETINKLNEAGLL